ncbi:hypothetical protein [Candidatus Poriferisodalis sp.]|uniref:hypothetical protein n=1 Tax=Candidatus Poriferisodalis sp. TaxID=3101277 RepID=UPI003C6FBAE5
MASASLGGAIARLRAKRRRAAPPGDSALPAPVEPTGGQAARIMADALWVEQITAEQAAQASGRDQAWVEGVVDGSVDPTLDELELTLNAIGLETRIALKLPGHPWPPIAHDPQRIADTIKRHRELDMEMYGQTWIRREPPQPGATAHLFGAGPGRQDGGGWAAILLANVLHALNISHAGFAARAGIAPQEAQQIATGHLKPPAGDFEQMLAANGVTMAIRIEYYREDDDEEHAAWQADPEEYEATIAAIRAELQAAKPVPWWRRRIRQQRRSIR